MITVYGIPNCDIIKKTGKWLEKHQAGFRFHDYRKEGISREKLEAWCKQVGWETLFNKRSTTWKELDPETQQLATNEKAAIDIMSEHATIIKRPVVEKNGKVVAVGFDEKALAGLV
ncbi:ArsC family reductase [Sediminibacterium soli]|uniref:ArsC family reductase n=1 Tax=Sediminibacterium soli TaxID=2698829 RepID=UPI00137B0898|nr:ArsC family reductase [Sediminibacterium soli]NCI46952.1 ArsC family reductase [Sediminibacterium soli]